MELETEKVIKTFISCIKDKNKKHFNSISTRYLKKFGSAAIPHLANALKREPLEHEVRLSILNIIGEIEGAEDAIPELIDALRDSNLAIASKAVFILEKIGHTAITEFLKQL